MLIKEKLYSLKDVCLIPCINTDIISRSECNARDYNIEGTENDYFPLIAAPMSCVLDENTYTTYLENKINCVIPRTVELEKRKELGKKIFTSFGIEEVENLLKSGEIKNLKYVLIDIANGHMNKIFELAQEIKKQNPELKLMGGNIANPNTYRLYDRAGFDFVRVSIGSGNGCLSSVQTAVHFPMASLIDEISEVKKRERLECKIIADGGMTCYSDIIKALALGADYVMCGMLFAKAAKNPYEMGSEIKYFGMSTKEAQKLMGKTELKTSEGKFLNLTKQYTLSGWVENFDAYLRSAMSYCDSRTLSEFRIKATLMLMSNETIKSIQSK